MAKKKGISKSQLNAVIKTLPSPTIRHLIRCKQLALYLTERVSTEDWYLNNDLNSNNIISAIYYHDIGKTRISKDHLYLKHCQTRATKDIYYTHTNRGVDVITEILDGDFNDFKPNSFERYLYDCVAYHHEKCNGTGNPMGKKKDEIPIVARICTLIDQFDNYLFMGVNNKIDFSGAIEKVKNFSGRTFDPILVDALINDTETLKNYIDFIVVKEKRKDKRIPYGVEMLYQPLIDLRQNKIFGYEALMRINDPFYGRVFPGLFISTAEKSRQIIDLGTISLEFVCATISKLAKKNIDLGRVSVNFSAKHFERPSFVKEVKKILKTFGVSPTSIAIEITERAIANIDETMNNKIKELREMGIHIYLDDFGEEYSSFSLLDNLQVDLIKISGNFITKILDNSKTYNIVNGLINIAKQLNTDVICEHIETQEEENAILNMGCYMVQGYKYSVPLKEKEIVKFVYPPEVNDG